MTLYEIYGLTQSHEVIHDLGKLQIGCVWNLWEPGFFRNTRKPLFAQPSLSKDHDSLLLNLFLPSYSSFFFIFYMYSLEREIAVKLSPPLHREPGGRLGRCAKLSHLPGSGSSNTLQSKAVGWLGPGIVSAWDEWQVPCCPRNQVSYGNANILEISLVSSSRKHLLHFPTQCHGMDNQWQTSKGNDKAAGREESKRLKNIR